MLLDEIHYNYMQMYELLFSYGSSMPQGIRVSSVSLLDGSPGGQQKISEISVKSEIVR